MTKSNTLKKLISVVLLAVMTVALFACNKTETTTDTATATDTEIVTTAPVEPPIDLDALDCKGECGDIKHFILEAEKAANLSDDAKAYLDLLKKNLVKMVEGFAFTEKSNYEGVSDGVTSKSEINTKRLEQGALYYEEYDATDFSNNDLTAKTWGSEDGSRYMETVSGNDTTRVKYPAEEGNDYERPLGDSGVSSALFLSKAFDAFLASIKKSTEGNNTVFTFKATVTDETIELLNSKYSNTTETKVTFDENGALKTIDVSMDVAQESLETHSVSDSTQKNLYTFTEIGVKQNITAPENVDAFEVISFE